MHLDKAVSDADQAPFFDGTRDQETGEPLIWNRSLERDLQLPAK